MLFDLRKNLIATTGHVVHDPHFAAALPALPPTVAPQRVGDIFRPFAPGRFVVAGTMDRRLLIAEHATPGRWTFADLSARPLASRTWPAWTSGHLQVDMPGRWISTGHVTEAGIARLMRPRIVLAALYHPENFPLPRFSLAIHDLARAARSALSGQVRLIDMQLGARVEDIVAAVVAEDADVLGVSATFGQHDLMDCLLQAVYRLDNPPLVIAGGSLTARNEATLLDAFPDLLVARGAGEPTITDVIAYWHGDLSREQIRGIGYRGAPRGGGLGISLRHTAGAPNRTVTDIFPELDLLADTFEAGGVAQLETSRGCTSTCSFCPRGHKGTWAGAAPEALTNVLEGMRMVFDAHPAASRTLYVVDEEFIGRGPDAADRAIAVAATVHQAGFKFESSCRVDQVVHPDRDRTWHVQRATMWRTLIGLGLRGMLFGIESGVTSVLDRFHKETTAEQNVFAVRTLSALGVPTRFTYITFDQLMTPAEFAATVAFQGRGDLLLRPLPHLPVEAIVDGVHDPGFVARNLAGKPFYTGISYMGVSMECLIGAPYTRLVERAGLAGEPDPSMGRTSAAFRDWRIGRCSHVAQLWVDRNFALDYLLKSLEKLFDGEQRTALRAIRAVLKAAAHRLLCDLVDLVDTADETTVDVDAFDVRAHALLDRHRDELVQAVAAPLADTAVALPDREAALLREQHRSWLASAGWRLINVVEPCTA